MNRENFNSRPMREVEYFGVKINIPADHEWVATDNDGGVYSYPVEPGEHLGVWVVPHRYEINAVRIGSFAPGVDNSVIPTLRHYPIEDE